MYTSENINDDVDFDVAKFLKVVGVVMAVMTVLFVATGFASAQTADTGDIEIDVDNDGTDYQDNVTLVDSSGNDVETIKTDGDGQAVFSSIEYGDYQLKTTVNASTVESNIFTHSDDTTIAEFDVGNNDLKVTGETQYVETTAPTPDNAANWIQNPSLPVLLGMGVVVFFLVGMVLAAIKSYSKVGLGP